MNLFVTRRGYTALSWSALRQVRDELFEVDYNECIKGILHNYILVALSSAIPTIPYIPGMSMMFVMAAIPRRPAIPRMVGLGGMSVT
ncbi:predicted protein [Pyrenophora tritici-repentis Pt-1C-BFP]|uniref:Uncharacterized protein n=1 Tax=Pyrenophora tritici-repentis (strain Pt-1C-BFP) TaxID=426418 RepID=B2W461_PYRTR|nr:uncharacterized protein PTRG_05261 [Pyrenophora tritici-repentis Pt-1C-BFP]EDU48168.1 predicted protein [Pyrenophora tritici-repentis Pt-1C-BFP]